MKNYKILDESLEVNNEVAYLSYYEKSQAFSIEISPEVKRKSLPIFFESFVVKRILTIDSEWSERWVRGRIVPEDRQNLGTVLRDNNLREYDLMKLLMKGEGRCAQDDLAIEEVDQDELPLWLANRQQSKLTMVCPLPGLRVLICFKSGLIKIVDLKRRIREDKRLMLLEKDERLFNGVKLQPGGNGICWNEWQFITAAELCKKGRQIDIAPGELRLIIDREEMDTAMVCKEMGCSRQYLDKLVKEGRLPASGGKGSRIYKRSDVEKLMW